MADTVSGYAHTGTFAEVTSQMKSLRVPRGPSESFKETGQHPNQAEPSVALPGASAKHLHQTRKLAGAIGRE